VVITHFESGNLGSNPGGTLPFLNPRRICEYAIQKIQTFGNPISFSQKGAQKIQTFGKTNYLFRVYFNTFRKFSSFAPVFNPLHA
jgi:hypothetical protein